MRAGRVSPAFSCPIYWTDRRESTFISLTRTYVRGNISTQTNVWKVEDENTDNKYCNLCGGKLDVWDAQGDFTINKDCITYGSIHDGDAVELHLCCKCFDALVASCVIDPVIEREETSLG